MEKYLIEVYITKTTDIIDRKFFNSKIELLKWLSDNQTTLFNHGFTSKDYKLIRIEIDGENL